MWSQPFRGRGRGISVSSRPGLHNMCQDSQNIPCLKKIFLFNHYTYSVEKGKDGDSPMLALRGELWVTGNKGSEWEAHYTGNGFNKAFNKMNQPVWPNTVAVASVWTQDAENIISKLVCWMFKEGPGRIYKSEAGDDNNKQTFSSGYSRAASQMNSWWLWQHSQNLCRPKPGHIPARRGLGHTVQPQTVELLTMLAARRGKDSVS